MKLNRRLVLIVVSVAVASALATSLWYSHGGPSDLTTSVTVHASGSPGCITEAAGNYGSVESCTFSDGRTIDCVTAGQALSCFGA